MNNLTNIINYTSNSSSLIMKSCGNIVYTLADKVNSTIKVIVIVMFFLLFFEMWAIKKIINSAETHEKKSNLIDLIMTFIHPVLIIFTFYLIYWIFLSGIDF